MKPKVIVLFSTDLSVQETVTDAVVETRHGLRIGATPEETLKILLGDRSDVDLYIVDLDEDSHGVSLLAALSFLATSVPIVLLTGFEPNYCSRLTLVSGAKACVGKPIAKEQIVAVIKNLLDRPPSARSDTRLPGPLLEAYPLQSVA
ncbi:MAG: hypothetical protein ABJF10_15540 [Chthoniobacter sp.]|uniref:hypothetical protein n=1 Tax=Chthoniobacter sp. TaxID=2510640 RepID=UPI0032AA56D5